ncbi:MAG: hypothetical protein ACOYEV_13980, partial [Candidatus Nanopelagicales bacterium]
MNHEADSHESSFGDLPEFADLLPAARPDARSSAGSRPGGDRRGHPRGQELIEVAPGAFYLGPAQPSARGRPIGEGTADTALIGLRRHRPARGVGAGDPVGGPPPLDDMSTRRRALVAGVVGCAVGLAALAVVTFAGRPGPDPVGAMPTVSASAEATPAGTVSEMPLAREGSGAESGSPGTTESGTTEAGTTEAGTTESGTTEAGTTEAGTTESGTTE